MTRTQRIRRLRWLAELLDSRFRVPGTNIRFGLDALVGLVPGAGDALAAAVSAWIVIEAARLGVPRAVLTRMVVNVLVDLLAGSVPLAGDLVDVAFRANLRNVELVERALGEGPP